MSVHLQLFSFPGEKGLDSIVDACRPYLENRAAASVAYMPIGTLFDKFVEPTRNAFHDLASIEVVDTEMMTTSEMIEIIRRANVVYIPGGNTFLLCHRLHLSTIFEYLRKKVIGGLPVVAFSAGTVFCGQNILTSNDMNIVPSSHFQGLGVTAFNFNVHYPQEETRQAMKDDWLFEYHTFHDNPVILLSDGASVQIDGRRTVLQQGDAWILRKGKVKEKLVQSEDILP